MRAVNCYFDLSLLWLSLSCVPVVYHNLEGTESKGHRAMSNRLLLWAVFAVASVSSVSSCTFRIKPEAGAKGLTDFQLHHSGDGPTALAPQTATLHHLEAASVLTPIAIPTKSVRGRLGGSGCTWNLTDRKRRLGSATMGWWQQTAS